MPTNPSIVCKKKLKVVNWQGNKIIFYLVAQEEVINKKKRTLRHNIGPAGKKNGMQCLLNKEAFPYTCSITCLLSTSLKICCHLLRDIYIYVCKCGV